MTHLLSDEQYKFDAGTNVYDTSEKQRVPAWTDRVLVKSIGSAHQDDAEVLEYSIFVEGTTDVKSDHKPVYALIGIGRHGDK